MTNAITTPVQVCNLSLSQIAARAQVQSINPSDGTAAGDACSLHYQPTVDAFSRAALWNCLRYQTGPLGSTFPPPLQLLKAAPGTQAAIANPSLAAPPQPWLFSYALPPDCIRARFLVPLLTQPQTSPPLTSAGGYMLPAVLPNTAIPFTVAVDLDSQGNETQVLLTNLWNAQLVYTRRLTNIALWDSMFTRGVACALATWLAPSLNGSVSLTNAAMGIAKNMLDMARVSDANEGPQVQDHEASWISARYGMSPGRGAGLGSYGSWEPFCFGNGISY